LTGGPGGGGGFTPRHTSWKPPFEESLEAFDPPRSRDDELPLDDCGVQLLLELERDAGFSDSAMPIVERSRRALTNLEGGREVFLIPTLDGGLCEIVTGQGSTHSCGSGSTSPSYSYWHPDRGPSYLWGIVPNEVETIDVVRGTETTRVKVQDNAFYATVPDDFTLSDVKLFANYEDGSRARMTP
jgi:hypothetical protein